MPQMRFSGRARNRMRRYRIAEDEVRQAVEAGQVLAARGRGLFHAWHARGSRWLRVFFVEEPQRVKVLTLTLERQGPPTPAGAGRALAEPAGPAPARAPSADQGGA